MWLAIKDLYTNVKAKVLYAGSLSREIDISQGTGQGRILAPFMYKVYINSLLKVSSDHCYAISINSVSLPSSPSLADDILLLALYPSFLETFMNICHKYGIKWRYEFNHTKSGVVTLGETKPLHSKSMKQREWMLGDAIVNELYEYKNLGVLKNYVNSFASNVEDNIEKARKKVGMIFSSDFNRRKTDTLIYITFWRQACLPSLLLGTELFTLNVSQLTKLERCQQWFLKNIFYVPNFASNSLLLTLSGLNSIESEIDLKKLMFLGRLITEPKMAPVVRFLFSSRFDIFFDATITSRGVLPSICDSMYKYNLFHYLGLWFSESIFPTYTNWKTIVKTKILGRGVDNWYLFCIHHPSMRVAQACLENISPDQFCSIADLHPDLVRHLHVQIRPMGNFRIKGDVPWLTNTDGELCLLCKESIEDVSHFLSDCPNFRDNRESLWSNLSQKVMACNPSDGTQISHFVSSLDTEQNILLLLGVFISLFTRLQSPW